MVKAKPDFDQLGVNVILISADSAETHQKFRASKQIPYTMLCDELHEVADQYGIPVMRMHPAAMKYQDGFIQPAIFVYQGEREIFRFIQDPKLKNLWGAAGRPNPQQILEAISPALRP